MDAVRRCKKCGWIRPIGDFPVYKSQSSYDGKMRLRTCRPCMGSMPSETELKTIADDNRDITVASARLCLDRSRARLREGLSVKFKYPGLENIADEYYELREKKDHVGIVALILTWYHESAVPEIRAKTLAAYADILPDEVANKLKKE